jgi:hypothetical protein
MTPYTVPELLASLVARAHPHIRRPVLRGTDMQPFHDHKGFNWMALRDEIGRRFALRETLGSPIGWLPPHINSQAWFVATRR